MEKYIILLILKTLYSKDTKSLQMVYRGPVSYIMGIKEQQEKKTNSFLQKEEKFWRSFSLALAEVVTFDKDDKYKRNSRIQEGRSRTQLTEYT